MSALCYLVGSRRTAHTLAHTITACRVLMKNILFTGSNGPNWPPNRLMCMYKMHLLLFWPAVYRPPRDFSLAFGCTPRMALISTRRRMSEIRPSPVAAFHAFNLSGLALCVEKMHFALLSRVLYLENSKVFHNNNNKTLILFFHLFVCKLIASNRRTCLYSSGHKRHKVSQ